MNEKILNQLINILNQQFLSLPLYKIIIAFLVLFLFIFTRKLFTLFILKSLRKLTIKTKNKTDDKVLLALKEPLKFLFIIIGFYLFLVFLNINNNISMHILKTMLIFDIFWSLYNLITKFESNIHNLLNKFGKSSKEISSFLIKLLKVFIVIIGIVAILQDLGINVSGFIASLGLGGLAFALAAKDTAANIFGGIAILTDNIFKIGEWVKIGNTEGIVEDIGMRTTKIRAFDKRLIIVPNSIIANSNIENFSRRDRRRIKMRIGIDYNTSSENIQKILKDIRTLLNNHPQIHKEPILIYFDEFEDSSLSIFCYFFTKTTDWEEYLKIREEINIKIKEIVEKNSSFAFPSQSLYIQTPIKIETE